MENRPLPSSKFIRDDAFAEIGAIDNSKQNFRLDTFIFQQSKINAKLARKFDKHMLLNSIEITLCQLPVTSQEAINTCTPFSSVSTPTKQSITIFYFASKIISCKPMGSHDSMFSAILIKKFYNRPRKFYVQVVSLNPKCRWRQEISCIVWRDFDELVGPTFILA